MHDPMVIIDTKLFWIPCATESEANYLTAVINSNALEQAVAPLMSKGQFGSRDLQKHLWRLAIPEYDAENVLHQEIAEAGANATMTASALLAEIQAARADKGQKASVTIVRRELRKWLETSSEGKWTGTLVRRLLKQ